MSDLKTASDLETASDLKARLQSDLTTALKAHDELRLATIRMTLAAVTSEEVAGKQARVLTDDDVIRVIGREAKKRRESAEAFAAAGRAELADRELAEGRVLDAYLPAQLSDDEVTALVHNAVAESGASGPRDMGAVMKLVRPAVAGRADGRRVSDEVKRQLAG